MGNNNPAGLRRGLAGRPGHCNHVRTNMAGRAQITGERYLEEVDYCNL